MNRLDEALLRPSGLLDQAETALRRALALRPHDVPTLARLGAVLRGKGDLAAALETYRRVTGLCPGHPEASWLSAVLGGAALPDVAAPEGTSAVPFVRMTDFLPHERCDDLLARVVAERERFVPAKVGCGRLAPDERHALIAPPGFRREVRAWFVPRLRGAVEAVLARLPPVHDLGAYRVELDVTAHPNGHFYKVHRDWGEEPFSHRRISYAWYFYREPRRFLRWRPAAPRHRSRNGGLRHRHLHAHRSAAQQHRLLPERLLPPDHPRARSRGRLRGRTVHGQRLVADATRRRRGRARSRR